jgi:uncharacterized protein YqhQ
MLESQEEQKNEWVPTNPNYDPNQPMQVGGQAVIEGVMMRAPNAIATAVRKPDGTIVVKKEPFRPLASRYNMLKLPVLRGAVGMIEMMYIGIQTLNYSAEIALTEEEKKETEKRKPAETSKEKKKESPWILWLTLVGALALGIAVFFALPLYVATIAFNVEQNAFGFNLTAGGVRVAILLLYLWSISWMKDIYRVFQYHGAEHKSVFAFELNAELIPSSVVKYSRFHPRCGTSFLLGVVVVAIISFGFLDTLLIYWLGKISLVVRLSTHLPFIPVVAGITYEFFKYSAKNSNTWWGRILVAPGLWLQIITTKEPDEKQLEVACVALRCALGWEDAAKYADEQPAQIQSAPI